MHCAAFFRTTQQNYGVKEKPTMHKIVLWRASDAKHDEFLATKGSH